MWWFAEDFGSYYELGGIIHGSHLARFKELDGPPWFLMFNEGGTTYNIKVLLVEVEEGLLDFTCPFAFIKEDWQFCRSEGTMWSGETYREEADL